MGSTTAAMTQSVALDFEEFFNEELRLHESFFEQLFEVRKTSQLTKTYGSLAMSGLPQSTAENADAYEDDVQEGYEYTVAVDSFSNSLNLSKLLKMSDQSKMHTVEKYAKDLAKKAVLARDVRTVGELFAKAYDTSVTYGDGKQWASVSHPRKDGGTAQGNTYADYTQRALDYDNLKLLEDEWAYHVSNKGMPLSIGLDGKPILMTGPILREDAMQLTGASGEPDVMSNNINYWKAGRNLAYIENPYMSWTWAYYMGWTTVARTSSDNYYDTMFVLIDPYWAKMMLCFDEMSPIMTETEYVKSNRQEIARVWDDFGTGLKGWTGFLFSKGDGSSFSS